MVRYAQEYSKVLVEATFAEPTHNEFNIIFWLLRFKKSIHHSNQGWALVGPHKTRAISLGTITVQSTGGQKKNVHRTDMLLILSTKLLCDLSIEFVSVTKLRVGISQGVLVV